MRIVSGLLSVLLGSASVVAAPASFKVMSYNVQNLFDTTNNASTNDEDFLPKGKEKWGNTVLADKVANLAAVIKSENPDIVGLAEVENQAVIDMLMNQGGLRAAGFVAGIAGPSDDARGIRCAILSKFPIVATKSHRVWKNTWINPDRSVQKTRDILEATVNLSGLVAGSGQAGLVTLLVNHWPARSNGPERAAFRLEVAQQMGQIAQSILNANPTRLLISIGDFNDELRDPSFTRGLMLVKNVSELATARSQGFFAADSELERLPTDQRGTFYYAHDKVWNSLDHVIVAKGRALAARQVAGFDYRANSLKVTRPRQFMTQGKIPSGCEISDKGRSGARCLGGASDHLPLSAVFEWRLN